MRDDVSDIRDFYNLDPQKEDIRLQEHQLEYDLTWRYLERYLPQQGSILEVGAATGHYTVELAKRGYFVTAVDLSAGLLEVCHQRVIAAGLEQQVRLVAADARDLSDITNREFDAVLIMGPLYHLIVETDRQAALKQAYDRLRTGGILVSVSLSRLGVIGDMLKKNPRWIENQAEVRSVLEHGKRPDDFPRGGFRGYLAHSSEIIPLHEAAGFETLILAGLEPGIASDDERYNRLEGEQRRRWLDLLYEISAEPSIIGSAAHLLYVGRKRG
jgi:SAM-dependent methyltransferase